MGPPNNWRFPSGRRICPCCHLDYDADRRRCPDDGEVLEECHAIVAGKFALKRLIGSGAMGEVYEALQLPMGRRVALKLVNAGLASDPDLTRRLEREALAASAIDHKNAVIIYDSGRAEDGQSYIAMEYLEGETVGQLLDREPVLPPRRAMALWLPVVEVMAAAHDTGILHRDLKPDNIFIARKRSRGGIEEQVKVLDFGLAKIMQRGLATLTGEGSLVGTALYLAPERLEGHRATPRSDVFALGLVLVEMLTGRLPWTDCEGRTLTSVMRRLAQPPLQLRELLPAGHFSPELQRLLDDALARDPAVRPADAGALLQRLREVPEAGPNTPDTTQVSLPRRSRVIPVGLGLCLIAALVLVVLGYLGPFSRPPPRHVQATADASARHAPARHRPPAPPGALP